MNFLKGKEDGLPFYTQAHITIYPTQYLRGIELYNAHRFHAAHDIWEERWLQNIEQREKLFLQGLIQTAVVFYHLEHERINAARTMYQRAREKFIKLNTSSFMSLNIKDYQYRLDNTLSWLLSSNDSYRTDSLEIEPPVIRLTED
jgi:hypothetical protein